jgi:hypothetical protein
MCPQTAQRGWPEIDVRSQEFQAIKGWIETFRPTRICTTDELGAIAVLGFIPSLATLLDMWSTSRSIMASVVNNPTVVNAMGQQTMTSTLATFIDRNILSRRREIAAGMAESIKQRLAGKPEGPEQSRLVDMHNCFSAPDVMASVTDHTLRELNESRDAISSSGGDALILALEAVTTDIIGALVVLIEREYTIRPAPTVAVDYQVRCNFGPLSQECGSPDVVIVLRPAILAHPDSLIDFGGNKAHRCTDGWAEAMTKKLMCCVALAKNLTPAQVKLDDAKLHWSATAVHDIPKCFLPSSVPVDYIEHVLATHQAQLQLMKMDHAN